MGVFRTRLELSGLASAQKRVTLSEVLVDTGSGYSWIPENVLDELRVERVRVDKFETASGEILERPIGFALFYVAGRSGASAVVFADPGDKILLGAHGLEGLGLRVDLARRELVPAGPMPVAAAA